MDAGNDDSDGAHLVRVPAWTADRAPHVPTHTREGLSFFVNLQFWPPRERPPR